VLVCLNDKITILTPIWTYGIQLWGTASSSNIEILERFQSKALHMIVDAPRYVPKTLIRRDLQIPSVKEEISRYSSHYSARLTAHPNDTPSPSLRSQNTGFCDVTCPTIRQLDLWCNLCNYNLVVSLSCILPQILPSSRHPHKVLTPLTTEGCYRALPLPAHATHHTIC
jgi:hypothetical protein